MIYGLTDDWNASNEGEHAVYSQEPDLIPAAWCPRVIYELRLDCDRLNSEVMNLAGALTAIYEEE